MECLKHEIIFDYINKELSEDNIKKIKNHLESCERCFDLFQNINSQILEVKNGLESLSPENIPESPFYLPQRTKKTSHGIISDFFQQPLKISIEFSWAKVFVLSLLILIFLSVFSLRKDRQINERDLQQLLMVADNYYDEDPKVDLNGNEMVILIFDQENKTFELLKANMQDGRTSSMQFKMDEKKPHLGI